MTKFHKTNEGQYLRCEAEKGKCPYGANADKTVEAVRHEAVRAFRKGEKIPSLLDTAGNERKFEFKADGSFKFGARKYDRHGVPVLGESARKKARLKRWRAYETLTPDQKAEEFTGDLFHYELKRGELKDTSLNLEAYLRYTKQHHGGSFRNFFLSVWDSITDAPTRRVRYKRTLGGMFTRVWSWLKGEDKAAS